MGIKETRSETYLNEMNELNAALAEEGYSKAMRHFDFG